jgi:hypothetical protein
MLLDQGFSVSVGFDRGSFWCQGFSIPVGFRPGRAGS